jgi:hypothetical protein
MRQNELERACTTNGRDHKFLKEKNFLDHVGFNVLTMMIYKAAFSVACCLLHAGFLFGLLLDSENGYNTFFRNVG